MQMPHRRKTALAAFALALAPVLSSCGFNYATDRDYTPGVGANNRAETVDVLSATVVSDQNGQGVFTAVLSNGSRTDAISLDSVTSDEADVSSFKSVEIQPQGAANLGDGSVDPIQVTDPGTSFVSEAPAKGATKDEHADEAHVDPTTPATPYDADVLVQPGKFVRVTLNFSNGESVEIHAPVVGNCGYAAKTHGLPEGPEHCPTGNHPKEGGH